MTERPQDRSEGPTVSVVVSTYNRSASVARLIGALERQTLPADRFEVVIVDNASTDDTARTLEGIERECPLRLRVIHLERNRGACAGRNSAWRQASAPIIAFTDDDCIPIATWLEEGSRELDHAPCVLVGATRPDPTQLHLLGPLARTVRVREPSRAPTCNIFYFAEDLKAVGGFDESFGQCAGEDTDLAWRVHTELGRELRFHERALVYHDVRPRSFVQALRENHRWAGIPQVVARHPELARRAWWFGGYFLRPSHPKALLAAIGIALARTWPPMLLLTGWWIRDRVLRGRPRRAWLRRLAYAPAMLVIDLHEIWVLARASLRHRALML